MISQIWRLSETSDHNNLGLACTDQGLLLGRTPLIERRDGCFVVRECSELEHLFSHAYGRTVSAQRLMGRGSPRSLPPSTPPTRASRGSPPCTYASPICPTGPRATPWKPWTSS